jgi:hypothetical protein
MMDETLIRALVTIVALGGSAAGMAWTIISWVAREGQDDGEWTDARGTEMYGIEWPGDEVDEELAARRRGARYAREHADWDARLARATGAEREAWARPIGPARRVNPRLSNRRNGGHPPPPIEPDPRLDNYVLEGGKRRAAQDLGRGW